ncbi:MAG: magnesium/cobalt transporter CorA [Candidatus Thermoplasmatota archaeon]|nr:magnesium/cobalt transporter CorA [Candidatus Thermoplasmatota archaeon]
MGSFKKGEKRSGVRPYGSFVHNLKLFSKGESKNIGRPPGELVFTGEKRTETVTVDLMEYDGEHVTEKEVKDVIKTLQGASKEGVTWININGLHDVELLGRIVDHIGIHPLVMEDIINTDQRPKVEVYDDYLFVVIRMLYYNSDGRDIHNEQVSLLLCKDYLLTFQEYKGDVFEPVRDRIRKNKGRIRKMKADYLAYSLIDAVVDNYFSLLEAGGDRIEDIERELSEDPRERSLRSIHEMKRELILMRRSVWPLRDVIHALEREEGELISSDTVIYLRDVYDHTIRVMDAVETYRDMVSGLLELYMSSISNRMNEIMKVLTIIATVFIPLTFIAGVYGMNFNPNESPLNMPELNWFWGYPFSLGLMLVSAFIMFLYFKKKKWI